MGYHAKWDTCYETSAPCAPSPPPALPAPTVVVPRSPAPPRMGAWSSGAASRPESKTTAGNVRERSGAVRRRCLALKRRHPKDPKAPADRRESLAHIARYDAGGARRTPPWRSLQKVKRKIQKYDTHGEFAHDMRLIFSNCVAYNTDPTSTVRATPAPPPPPPLLPPSYASPANAAGPIRA